MALETVFERAGAGAAIPGLVSTSGSPKTARLTSQSFNPHARLREHWRTHRDLVRACFLPCPRADLDLVEEQLVAKANEHFRLRNIKLAIATSREERLAFHAGGTMTTREWRELELLTRIQMKKVERLCRAPWAEEALQALHLYIHQVLPKPADTEVRFWSASIFPERGFIRVNAGQQEVFT
jgi:hypothetical protein